MALTKVSGPLLDSSNNNLGNYVINNITGAAATFTSLDCSNIDLSADDLKIVGIITNSVLTPERVVWVGTGNTLTESDNLTWDNTNVRLKSLGITSTRDLKVTGISTVGKTVFLSGQNPNIRFDDSDTDNNGEITLDNTQLRIEVDEDNAVNSSALKFRIDGGDVVTINSDGEMGVGTNNPDAMLHVTKSVSTAYDAGADSAQRSGTATINVENNDGTTNSFAQIAFDTAGSNQSIARIVALRTGTSSNDLAFVTEHSNTKAERLRIESGGDVGIGTTNPAVRLHVLRNHNSAAEFRLENNEGYLLVRADSNVATYGAQQHLFHNRANSEEYLRITSDGKLLIGVNASTSSNAQLQSFKPTGNDSTIVVGNVATSASGLCRVDFCPSNSTVGARIECHATEDFSTTANRTADLVFVTRKDGTNAEKLRIDSDGRLLQNGITAVDDYMHQMEGAGGTGKVPAILFKNGTASTDEIIGGWTAYNSTNQSASIYAKEESANDDAYLQFSTRETTGSLTERLRIDSTGKVVKQKFTATNTYAANDTTQCGYQAQNLSDTTNTYAALRLTAGNSSPATAQIASIRTGTGQNDLTVQLESSNTAFEALRINSSGQILVGTTAHWGSDVKLHLANASNTYLTLTSGTTHNGVLAFSDDGTERGAIDYDHDGDHMLFKTAATERLRMTGIGSVGVNITNPAAFFQINSTKNAETDRYSASNYHLALRNPTDTNDLSVGLSFAVTTNTVKPGAAIIHQRDAGGSQGGLQFYTSGDGSSITKRLEITSDGKLWVDRTHASATTGNHPALDLDTHANGTAGATFSTGIDFRCAGVHKKRLAITNADSSVGTGDWIFYRDNGTNEGLTIKAGGDVEIGDGNLVVASGHGIDFSATSGPTNGSSSSELFDDYEEGSFTPNYTTSSGSGSISVSGYDFQAGRYVKIGQMVYVEGRLRTNGVTVNSSGTYDIGGLPFTSNNDGGATQGVFLCSMQHSWTNAPHQFAMMNNNTLARAREGIAIDAGTYTNGNTNGFNESGGNHNRTYFVGCYRVP